MGQTPTMPKDPKWTRRTDKAHRAPWLAAQRPATFPDPLTRQVRRQEDRLNSKPPLILKPRIKRRNRRAATE